MSECPLARTAWAAMQRARSSTGRSRAYPASVRAMRAAVILLTVPSVVAGCGSSSSSGQTFRPDANRICSQYGRKVEAVNTDSGQTARALAKTIALLEQMNRSLQRLTPPPREERRFQQFLAVERQSLREMRRIQRFVALNE